MSVEKLRVNGKEIILVGTAHISQKSVEEVRQVIELEMPDAVGIELDEARLSQLASGNKWQETNIGDIISKGQAYLFLLTLLMANIQRRLGQKLGIRPGEEMMQAINIASEKKIPISLLDRNVNITMKRAFQKMSILEKIKLAGSVFAGFFEEGAELTKEKIEEMKQKDILTELIDQLGKEMPSIKKVLVDERDLFIANRIMQTPGRKIVAVVGAGHVSGILKNLGKQADLTEISSVKKGFDFVKIIGWLIPLVFFALLGTTLLSKGPDAVIRAGTYWILVTGGFAALGTLIARGHPFTIIAAFLSAPLTTLHPLLAVGFVTAYVEAKIKNPKVRDFESLRELNSLGDFTKNRVTKILIIAAFSNIGATVGTIIGLPLIASLLG